MRHFLYVFCAVVLSIAAMQAVQAASDHPQAPPVPANQTSATAPSSGANCINAAYNHYLESGIAPRNAWNDAVRDCQNGVDSSCIQFAQQHYLDLGENPNTAWSNAVRDCRTVAPSVTGRVVPYR